MHSEFDVIVVGAGPAGTVAAMRLARAGVRVRIVDRETFPRHKLCGDTLNPGCLSLLSQLDSAVAQRVRARALKVSGMTVTGPGNVTVHADYPQGISGASLMRRDLDQWLLETAVNAGATFDPGIAVLAPIVSGNPPRVVGVHAGCGRNEREFRSPVVIAADGRASRVAAQLNLSRFCRDSQRWAYGAYFTDVEGLTAHGEMHVRADGYVGVAPVPGALANICVVRARRQLVAGESGERVIARGISSEPALAERFARARRVSAVSVLGPLAVESQVAGCPGLLLAGDAAGFVDPMTGDGLRFAIAGGDLAARAALLELESGASAHAQLHAWRVREFKTKWRINRALRTLVGSPRALSCAALAARAWQAPVQRLVGLAGDVYLARHAG